MNLCVVTEVLENRERKIETYNFIESEMLNGKSSWVFEEQYFLYWSTGTTNQWILSGFPNTFIYTFSNTEIPFTNWQILGSRPPKQITNLRITTGECENNVVVDYNVNIKNSSCKCDGIISIDPFSGTEPFTYYLNGQIQTGNIIQNLCSGRYVITVEDVNGNTTIKEVVIPQNDVTQYFVTLNFDKTTGYFNIFCNPSLNNNIQLSLDLVYQNTLKYKPNFGDVSQNTNEQIILNGNDIGQYTTKIDNTQSTPLLRPCVGNNYNNVTTKEWKNLIIGNGDTLEGYISSDLIYNVDLKTPCLSASQDLVLNLNNLRIINCECCNVTKVIINK
jgi:hypothetical protein